MNQKTVYTGIISLNMISSYFCYKYKIPPFIRNPNMFMNIKKNNRFI